MPSLPLKFLFIINLVWSASNDQRNVKEITLLLSLTQSFLWLVTQSFLPDERLRDEPKGRLRRRLLFSLSLTFFCERL